MAEEVERREYDIAGTELKLFTATHDKQMSTRISWPPHGIERPVCIRLTLSEDEVTLLAGAWRGEKLDEALALAEHINHAVVLQCAMLRKMQAAESGLTVKPSDVEPL